MTPLPYLTLHRIGGADTEAFLQAQLAADVASLDVGASGFAAWCSHRGQVIAVFLVCREADAWILACDARLARTVFERLRRYVLRARVEFEALDGVVLAGLPPGEQGPPGQTVFEPQGVDLRYVLLDRQAQSKSPPDATSRLRRWQVLELKHGITWLQPATSERFIPQMLGLEQIGAVSFAKGCYPGQEIVARTRYLGKLKRNPVLVEVDGLIPDVAGEPCTVFSEARILEAVVVEALAREPEDENAAVINGAKTLVLIVAPMEETTTIDAVEVAGRTWTARRLRPERAA